MTDLITAAQKQIEYARNELKSGDKAQALEHLNKAAGFLDRAASDVAPAEAAATDAGPLSDDPSEAQQQLLARIGVAPDADAATVIAAASDEQIRELALLGVFGQPGAFPAADYSLFQTYYEPSSPPDEENGLQSWAPKPEWAISGSAWKHYVQSKGS